MAERMKVDVDLGFDVIVLSLAILCAGAWASSTGGRGSDAEWTEYGVLRAKMAVGKPLDALEEQALARLIGELRIERP